MADDLLGRAIQIAGRQVLCKHLGPLCMITHAQKTVSSRKLAAMLREPEAAANEAANIIRKLVDEVRKLRKEVDHLSLKPKTERKPDSIGRDQDHSHSS